MRKDEFLKKLFQMEFSKMVAVISKMFGLQHVETAEDIVSETFLLATETWGRKGVPKNPTAWLYSVAKQKTLYQFRRGKIFAEKVTPELKFQHMENEEIEDINFSPMNIRDSQLQMLFAICNPAISSEAQIGLALRILCGFSIDEIADAFLTNKETINKRLYRAKEKLRTEGVKIALPPPNEIVNRLDNVLRILYLLFSEGYYSKTQNQLLRNNLCLEALRLGTLLTFYEKTNLPKTNALLAMMCFHSSRFNARQIYNEVFILYDQQDKQRWDTALINEGRQFLYNSAQGNELTSYHLEAKIAYWHCVKADSREKWEDILQLYNQLLFINYSPSVALNRTFAFFKVNGPHIAIVEAEKLKLETNHFYFVLLGELCKNIDSSKAKTYFKKAYSLAKTEVEKKCIQEKIDALA
ncbi:MAG: RNA polymerase sigma factor [Mucilaginibacter sp.]